MFALLLIKFNRYPLRTRLLAGLSVVLILTLLITAAYYRFRYYDRLSRFTSPNTIAYLHLDWRDMPENFYKIKLADAILEPFGLADIDRRLLQRESAVICDEYRNELVCGLIIQTDQINELQKYLVSEQINFKKLNSNSLIASQNDAWLKTVKRSFNFFRYFRYQSAVGRFSALTLALNQPRLLNNELGRTLYLAGVEHFIKLNGSAAAASLVFEFDNWLIAPFRSAKIKNTATVPAGCDIFISSNDGIGAKPLTNYLGRLIAGPTAAETDFLIQPFTACLRRTGSTGNVLNDYGWTLASNQPIGPETEQKIEKLLLSLAARLQPRQKNLYLSDGTRVAELFLDNRNLSFVSATGTRAILLSAGQNLYYATSSAGLLISNEPFGANFLNLSEKYPNYASVKINSLPQNQIKRLLSEFSYLLASDKQIIVR
ncbi:MAG: hypothetical protein WC517_02375 [Patescibacteria group bacterium]